MAPLSPGHLPGQTHADLDGSSAGGRAVFQTATFESLCRQLGDSGPGLLDELIGLYLVQAQGLVGQIETAIADGDPSRRRAAAHKLRGSTATLGGDRLADVCLRLEVSPAADPLDVTDQSAHPTEQSAGETTTLTATAVELRGELEALALVLTDYRRSLRTDGRREIG